MKSRPAPSASATRFRRKPLITALEPRLLLDGAAVATTVDMATDVDYQDQTADQTVHSASAEDSVHFTEAAAPTASEPSRREVAFIDTQVQDYQALVDGMAEGVEVFLIEAGSSGLEQMLTHLQGQSGIDAIHVYSHGAIGQLTVGSLTLNGDNLAQYGSLLTQLGETLTENGDLMLYGCYVGSYDEGQAFIDEIGRLSGADVAASSDRTGSSSVGGDWELERTNGSVETDALVVPGFEGVLAAPVISNLASSITFLEGSGAITIDSDIVIGSGGTYTEGFVRFSITSPNSGDQLTLSSSATPTAHGAISLVGSDVYLGNGTTRDRIGSIDATENGQNGAALKILFSSPLPNAGFEEGEANWTIVDDQYGDGGDEINFDGYRVPLANNSDGNSTYVGGTGTVNVQLSDGAQFNGSVASGAGIDGSKALYLSSSGRIVSGDQLSPGSFRADGYGSIHGPYARSSVISVENGDSLSLEFKAVGSGDDYEVFGLLRKVNGSGVFLSNSLSDGNNIVLFAERGADTGGYKTVTYSGLTAGEYRFEFVGGTYDGSGGLVVGSNLYVDNIRLISGTSVTDSVASTIARQVQYQNTATDSPESRTLTISARNQSGETGSSTTTLNIDQANNAPSFNGNGTLNAVNEDTTPAGSSVSSLFNDLFSDPDTTYTPADTLAGIAIVGDVSTSTQGTWEYSTNSGTNWYAIGSVSTSDALLLSSSTLIRFRPSADWNGTPGSLAVHAVDSSHAGGFTNGSGRVTFNTTTDDATSAVSASAVNLSTSITAVNDAPVLTNGADTDSLTETDTTLTTSGSMTVTDVDLTDTVAITVDSVATGGTFSGINPLTNAQLKAMLAASATSPANIAALAADPSAGSTFDWTFTSGAAGDAAFNFLREGETLILTYTLKATDSSGASSTASSTSTVTITITGTNENVTVSATPSGGYLEAVDASAQTISESGTVSFADVDLTDRINITFASNNDIVWKKASGAIPGTLNAALINQLIAGFQVGAVDAPVPGSVPWTYNIADADLDFLNIGDTITFSYTVTATDSSGATATDVVRFTFTGTNDVPVADMVVIDQTWPFGKPYELDIAQRFSDRDARASGEDLDFTLTGLPGGLSYNAETGLISGIPTGIGKFTITMTATDRQGTSVTRQFVLEVLAPPQPPVMTPVADAPPPPSAPALDTTQVTNDTTPLPSGTVSTGFSTDPVQEAGFMAPTRQIVEPSQAGNGSTTAGSAGPGNVSAPDDGASAGNSGTERILVAEGNTRVSEVVSPDGRVTSVRASIQVEVATNGQVVFNDVQKQAFGIVGLSVSSISSGDNGLSVSIADAARGQDTQFYTGELGNGESLPDWITVDQTTGEITIGNPPPGIDAVTVRVKAIGSDGKVRMLDIELKLSDLLKRKSLQDLQPDSTETLEPVGFVPLTDQVAAEVASSDGYGERLIALLEAA